ncbi:MAG: UvrB/UvrC protein [Acidobacteriaceae bacterium]|nr:UvrB/UvrC protein [Acidobacteriaceae bacterium]
MLTHSIPFSPERDKEIIAQIPEGAGAFLLRGHDAHAEPYISKAVNLRRRIMRLLAPAETQSKRLNLRERCALIEYSSTGSDFENVVLLYQLLRKIFPETYTKRLRLNLSPLIRIHWENAYPRAYVTRKLGRVPEKALNTQSVYYGPFRSRAVADRFLNDALDFFKSRRCTFELNPDPAFPGCIYSEMKMCLAPCFKGCTDEEYFSEMRRVQDFLDTRGESLISEISAQRDKASTDLEFENAAALHARVEKVKTVARECDEIIRRIDRLDALIVQPSASAEQNPHQSNVALFRIVGGQIVGPMEFSVLGMAHAQQAGSSSFYAQPLMVQPVPLESSAEVIIAEAPKPEVRLREVVESLQPNGKISVASQAEQLAILKRWYYKSSRVGEIFFRDTDADWPWRRILNGVSRVFVGTGQKLEPQRTQSDAKEEPTHS